MADAPHVVAVRRPPWTVIAFLPALVVWVVAFYLFTDADAGIAPALSGLLLPVAIGIGVWRRGKLAWYIAAAMNIGAILLGAMAFFGGNQTLGLVQFAGGGLLLWLLQHDESRRWCDV